MTILIFSIWPGQSGFGIKRKLPRPCLVDFIKAGIADEGKADFTCSFANNRVLPVAAKSYEDARSQAAVTDVYLSRRWDIREIYGFGFERPKVKEPCRRGVEHHQGKDGDKHALHGKRIGHQEIQATFVVLQ